MRVLARLVRTLSTLFAVSLATFSLTSLLKGDAAQTILGPQADPSALAALRQQMHLNGPFYSRFFSWLGDAVRGNLGVSYTQDEPVSRLIWNALPVTLELVFLSLFVSLVIAIPLGVLSAYRPRNILSRLVRVLSYGLLSIPPFVIGVVLVTVFALEHHLFPAAGWRPLTQDPFGNLRSVVLPVATLSLGQIAIFTQVLRGDMTNTLDQDFVAFADAKGLAPRRILFAHAFRPSSFSLFTLAGATLGYLIGGTVIVEVLFNLPGLGTLLTQSIAQRDLITVQGVTLFIAAAFVLTNFVVDALYGVLDPRIRMRNGSAAS